MTEILAVVGPTASGKSALALALAERLSGEIVSCDSMQIYRRMDIGTAKPTKEERAAVPHHMIDIADPGERYSCADYAKDAKLVIADIAGRGKLPIICGGTGLYLNALINGSGTADIETDPDYEAGLSDIAASDGGREILHAMLSELDPEAADAIHPNNVKRVIRALVINRCAGMTKSEWDRRSVESGGEFSTFIIGLNYMCRENLYSRINARVDMMMESGLEDEVRALLSEGFLDPDTTASQAIGYKELIPYVRGEISRENAVETLKMSTRRYAKRQLTWFGRVPGVNWIYPDADGRMETFENIVNNAINLFNNR